MHYLDLAADLANKVDWREVYPNPRVGCVIIQNGEILATGVHEKYGEAHAEVNAILALNPGSNPGLEVYITLEPCDHFPGKKTGSCTQKLIELNPEKVIIGLLDERFGGKNVEKLHAAGIKVEVVNHQKSKELSQLKPHVILKMAQTLDGKISSLVMPPGIVTNPCPPLKPRGGKILSAYISSLESRKKVHQLRSEVDAILTTTSTISLDNPLLDCRLVSKKSVPRLLVFGQSSVDKKGKVFQFSERKIDYFSGRDLSRDLREISEMGVQTILTECGAKMATSLLQEGLVDEIWFFIAPKIFGKGVSIFLKEVNLLNFEMREIEEVGGDILVKFTKKN